MSELDRTDLAWCLVEGRLIFLDVASDRYFRLTDARNRECLAELGPDPLRTWHQPEDLPRPADWEAPTTASPAITEGDFDLAKVARAIWVQRRVARRLAAGSFAQVLADLHRLVEQRSAGSTDLSERGRATIRAFEQARLLRTAADRCLARSIALAICLASRGDRAQVVLGVRAVPFGAHCWAQQGAVVLNDSVEEVLRYHPILVV